MVGIPYVREKRPKCPAEMCRARGHSSANGIVWVVWVPSSHFLHGFPRRSLVKGRERKVAVLADLQ